MTIFIWKSSVIDAYDMLQHQQLVTISVHVSIKSTFEKQFMIWFGELLFAYMITRLDTIYKDVL